VSYQKGFDDMKLDDSVADQHLLRIIQKQLSLPENYNTKKQLVNISKCTTGILRDNAILVSNSTSAKFLNVIHCNSAWSCPRCTAEVMAKKGALIACAIDALKTWYDETACMITFTLPHSIELNCKDAFDIFLKTWRAFTKPGNIKTRTKHYTTTSNKIVEKGTERTYKVGKDPYGSFREDLGINKHVKVYEFTWGKNNFHPHIHALFWVPTKNFNKVVDYEEGLLDRWWKCAKHQATLYLNEKYPDKKQENQELIDKLYSEEMKKPKTGFRSVYISKHESGKPIAQKSSWYITGWTGDKELTRLAEKQAREGHLTPHQIMEKIETDSENREKWFRIYAEYALATRKHRRVEFSKSKDFSFKELITKWQQTQTYMERLKKKYQKRQQAKWFTICSFTKKDWLRICIHDRYYKDEVPLSTIILAIASRASPQNLSEIQKTLSEFLEKYNIEITLPTKEDEIATASANYMKIDPITGEVIYKIDQCIVA